MTLLVSAFKINNNKKQQQQHNIKLSKKVEVIGIYWKSYMNDI